jgi:hypothetical protein
MDPVTRALQIIAAIQSESRGPSHAEAAPRCPTEPLRSQNLGASSLASSNECDRPTTPSATTNGTAKSKRGSAVPPTAHVTQAVFAREREIRIDGRDRVVVPPARDGTRQAVTIITGAFLLGLAICLGWICGLNSASVFVKPTSVPVEKLTSLPASSDAAPKSERATLQTSSAITAHDSSKRRGRTSESFIPKQPPAVDPTKSLKPTPVPETKPTTIEGWTLLEVMGGTAVLEGPNGVWRATRGDTVPGIGKIDSIVRWGNRWIVATSRGLISTR